MLYDLIAFVIINWLFYVVYDPVRSEVFKNQLIISIITIFACRVIGSIYSQIWRYGGIQCYIRLLVTDGVAFILGFTLNKILYGYYYQVTFVRMLSFYCINLLVALSMRMIYRYAFKCGNNETLKGRFLNSILRIFTSLDTKDRSQNNKIKIAIVGAGRIGVGLAEELMNNEGSAYSPRCFIDIKADKVGREIYGIPVISEDKATITKLKQFEIQEIVFAIHGMDNE